MDGEQLGRIVRLAWLKWLKTSPSVSGQRPESWYAEWDALKEEDKECDRQIGEAVKAALESAISPSTLIAAVEAKIPKAVEGVIDSFYIGGRIEGTGNDINALGHEVGKAVLNLLRSPPTEEVA